MTTSVFPKNQHSVDRLVRVLVGAGAVSLAIAGPQTPWGWLGLIPLITGFVGLCPLYRLFGVSTCTVR